MVLAVSGDVDPKAALKRLETRLAGWEKGKAAPWPPAPPSHRPAPGLFYVDRSLPQAQVAIGRLGLTRGDRDRHAAVLANQILGGGGAFTTRLMQRLRTEEGLVYGVSSELGVGPLWAEPFQIRFAADPAKVPQAIDIARAELRRLCAEPPTAAELETAQSQLLAQIADTFGSARKMALAFALGETLGRPHRDWRDDRAGILAAGAADVQAAACRALSADTMLILVVGAKLPEPAKPLPLLDPLTLKKP
jgi:zinc protease